MLTQLKLRRQNGMLTGVCGGLGAYFGIDPWVFRIIFIVLSIVPGPALIPYLLLWLIMPTKRSYRY